MSSRKSSIEKAIVQALIHAKENGIQPGAICATRADDLAFEFIERDGDKAIVNTVNGRQVRPFNEVFDVDLVQTIAEQIFMNSITGHEAFVVKL